MSRKIRLARVHHEQPMAAASVSDCGVGGTGGAKRRRIEPPQCGAAAVRPPARPHGAGAARSGGGDNAGHNAEASGSVVNMLLYPELMSRSELVEQLQARQLSPDGRLTTLSKDELVRLADDWFVPKPRRRAAHEQAPPTTFEASRCFDIVAGSKPPAAAGGSPSIPLAGGTGVRSITVVKRAAADCDSGGQPAKRPPPHVNGKVQQRCALVANDGGEKKTRSPIKFP